MKVAIVVLSWNSKKYIGECLDSLKKTKTEIIRELINDQINSDSKYKDLQNK